MSARPLRIKSLDVLSPRDRERLRREIEMDRRRLKGDVVVPTFRHIKEGNPTQLMGRYQQFMDRGIQEDPGEIIQRMRRHQKALDQGTPQPLGRRERERLEKRAMEDREWLKNQMCPKKLYYTKDNSPDFQTAVEACKRERTQQFAEVSNRYKNAMRQLDPETPDASSVEKLRPS